MRPWKRLKRLKRWGRRRVFIPLPDETLNALLAHIFEKSRPSWSSEGSLLDPGSPLQVHVEEYLRAVE